MIHRRRSIILLIATVLTGGGGLLAFAAFLFGGPPSWITFGWSRPAALCWDGALSLLFFIQHSGMLRRRVRQFMGQYMPESYLAATYSIVSGGLLLALVILWQATPGTVVALSGWGNWLARTCFFLSVLGFMWTSKNLGSFDPLGLAPLMPHPGTAQPASMSLAVSGPYRWVRHPFYFFTIVMIWSFPTLTHDRLLFNLSWTVWIWIGALLEERDLVNAYGKTYQDYQKSVPMLFPLTLPKQPGHKK